MKINGQYLYDLLPAYYRVIDDEHELPLKALAEILAREAGVVEDNINQLYENWFIETCEEWVVPYIGDLLGVRNIHEVEGVVFSRRAYVANTLGYRRRKGTGLMLEQLAMDVTGWRAKVVEFFQLLAATQNMNHVRLHSLATPDMRNMNALDLLNTAFDTHSHTIDVGRISKGLGKYNISNIGIYLWRLQAYPMKKTDARKIEQQAGMLGEGYTFSPLGLDTQLFNHPQTEEDITHLAEEINVPGFLRRRALHDELERARQTLADGGTPEYVFLRGDTPAFNLYVNGNTDPVPKEEIVICNLVNWKQAPATKTYKKVETDGSVSEIILPITAAVDPVLGRITFSDPGAVSALQVDHNYGFSGDLGGGPYDRRRSLEALQPDRINWQVGVSKDHSAVAGETVHPTLQAAISEWNGLAAAPRVGLITIMDNRSYEEDLSGAFRIRIGEGQQLYIIAAGWPLKVTSGVPERKTGTFNPEDLRPHIKSDWEMEGTAPAGSPNGGGITINGLLIEGKVTVVQGNLDHCTMQHCTLVPYMGGLESDIQDIGTNVTLQRSICGPVRVHSSGAFLQVEECLIDVKTGDAVSVPNGQLAFRNSTIWGKVIARSLDAENSIFNDLILAARRQAGCVRFCYLPIDSISPRRYRCQPELEIQTILKEREEQGPLSNAEKQKIRNAVLNRVFPVFNSNDYGHHAYGQLGSATPVQITTGADNASEMGAFNFLQQPQREANLHIVLEEYLRLGLEAGIIYVT